MLVCAVASPQGGCFIWKLTKEGIVNFFNWALVRMDELKNLRTELAELKAKKPERPELGLAEVMRVFQIFKEKNVPVDDRSAVALSVETTAEVIGAKNVFRDQARAAVSDLEKQINHIRQVSKESGESIDGEIRALELEIEERVRALKESIADLVRRRSGEAATAEEEIESYNKRAAEVKAACGLFGFDPTSATGA